MQTSSDARAAQNPDPVPVVIVGAGPVGLTLALTLARNGVRCVLLEDEGGVCQGSRALGMSRRTLEIWDALGAVDRISAHGRPWDGGRSFWREHEVLRFRMPDDERLKFRPMLNIQQCHTETYLSEAVQSRPEIELRWLNQVTAVRPDTEGVEIDVRTSAGTNTLRALHVVACDGARSTVRDCLGLRLAGSTHEASYLIADIKLDTDAPIERRCWFDPPSNPGSTVLMHGQPDQVWRLDYQLLPGEDAEQAQAPAEVRRRISKHLQYIGEHGSWTLEWVSVYRAHSRCLDSFRYGRVFFAGDAAHLMPIFGIRGLNSGVEDAWNLGWKLGHYHRGFAGDGLLDSYSIERRRTFLENAALADRNAWFMTPPAPGARLVRDAVLQLASTFPEAADIINPRQASYVPLRDSPLSTPDEASFEAGPPPGDQVPDLMTTTSPDRREPSWLLSQLSNDWTILEFVDVAASQMDVRQQIASADTRVPVTFVQIVRRSGPQVGPNVIRDDSGELWKAFGAASGTTYLVRPDHNVAARWKTFDAEAVRNAVHRAAGSSGVASKGESGLRVPLSNAEQIYRVLGQALGDKPQAEQTSALARIALALSFQVGDVDRVRQLVERVSQLD